MTQLEKVAGKLSRTEQGKLIAKKVPLPHSEFEEYIFVVSPSTGLCKIHALGKTIENDAYGYETKNRFEKLSSQLEKPYGVPGDKFDYLFVGSIWNDPDDWMMALRKKERVLDYYWIAEKGVAMKDSITAIALGARGLSPSKGYLVLTYEFENAKSCSAELTASDANAL